MGAEKMSDAEKCINGAIIPEAQTYTPDEFVRVCTQSGYASRKTAKEYVAKHAGRPLTDDDLIEAYRDQERKLSADERIYKSGDKYAIGNGSYTTKTISGDKE